MPQIVRPSTGNTARYRPRSRGDNTFRSVCVHVCVSVCLWALSCLNRLTLIFGMRVDLDLGYPEIVGQGRRSKVKVKQ